MADILNSGAGAGATTTSGSTVRRVDWLDGVRGLAAFFVVLHHVWLMTIGGYPGNNGPWYSGWLVYGHLAVSVFIVVSGFSLTLSPAAHGMVLKDGGWGFVRRRFWRIVPPYWMALLFSAVLVWTGLTPSATGAVFGAKDFLVHFLLIQDTVGNVAPNGVFWSIAVEWHIYFLFPLLLICMRRFGFTATFATVAVLVVLMHTAGAFLPFVGEFDRFSPAYLVLFLAGAGSAWLSHRGLFARTGVVGGVLLLGCFLVLTVAIGSERAVANYFWIDLLVGVATACVFTGLAQRRLRWLAGLLALRPVAFVGTFAFSLYLCHAPVLAIVHDFVVEPAQLPAGAAFWLLLALGVPASLVLAFVFFWLFERPFLTIRSFSQAKAAVMSIGRPRRKVPAVPSRESNLAGLLDKGETS